MGERTLGGFPYTQLTNMKVLPSTSLFYSSLVLFLFSLPHPSLSTTISLLANLNRKNVIFNIDVILDGSAPSALSCARSCLSRDDCASFTFHAGSVTSCRCHGREMTSEDAGNEGLGAVHYLRQDVQGQFFFIFQYF